MANLIAAPGLLMILQKLGVQPRVIWFGNMAIVLYLPWLITLPMFGGFGASLSRRVQGSSLSRLIAGLAPALAILGVFAFVLPASLASLFFCTAHLTGFPWLYFGLTVCNWVVLPACALLIGALPFLKGSLPSKTLLGENNHA
jgi:hypothetical protein